MGDHAETDENGVRWRYYTMEVPRGTSARIEAVRRAINAAREEAARLAGDDPPKPIGVGELKRQAMTQGASILSGEVDVAWTTWTADRRQRPTYNPPTSPAAPEAIEVCFPYTADAFAGVREHLVTTAIHLRVMHPNNAPDVTGLAWRLRGVALVKGVELLETETRTAARPRR